MMVGTEATLDQDTVVTAAGDQRSGIEVALLLKKRGVEVKVTPLSQRKISNQMSRTRECQ